jgi:hypothetical protein
VCLFCERGAGVPHPIHVVVSTAEVWVASSVLPCLVESEG